MLWQTIQAKESKREKQISITSCSRAGMSSATSGAVQRFVAIVPKIEIQIWKIVMLCVHYTLNYQIIKIA